MKDLFSAFVFVSCIIMIFIFGCGDGSINMPTSDDDMMIAMYSLTDEDYTKLQEFIPNALTLCDSDEVCRNKIAALDGNVDAFKDTSKPEEQKVEDPDDIEKPKSSVSTRSSSSMKIIISQVNSSSSVSDTTASSASTIQTSTSGIIDVNSIEVDGKCTASKTEVDKGTEVGFVFTKTRPTNNGMPIMEFLNVINAYDSLFKTYECNWKVKDKTYKQDCGAGTFTNLFEKPGLYDVAVTIKEKEFTCGNVTVNGAPITGCKCKPDNYKPNVVDGAVDVLWTVSGCTTNGTITGYDWEDATGSGETATASFNEKAQIIKPTVAVMNDDGTVKTVYCDSAKAIDTSKPDYEIVKGETLEVPVGECGVATVAGNIRFEHPYEASNCDITLTINGTEYSKTVSYCNVYYNVLPCDGITVSSGTQICVNEVTSNYGKIKMKYQ